MHRTATRLVATVALALGACALSSPADARPAQPFRYAVEYADFSVCDEPATLIGRVFLNSRSTGSEGGIYTSTFLERTVGTLTVGDDTYRYNAASQFSEVEEDPAGDVRTQRLAGTIRLSGAGSLAGTVLEQRIHTVVDANGVTHVETYISSFC